MLSFAVCKISVISIWFLFLDWTDGPVSVLNYVPSYPTCLTRLRAFASYLPSLFYVPYVSFFFYVPYVPSVFYVPYVPSLFYFLYMPLFFYMPYVPSFFTCLTCLQFLSAFTFLSVSNFRRTLRAFTFFIKCGTTHNQSQQAGICKNEVKT